MATQVFSSESHAGQPVRTGRRSVDAVMERQASISDELTRERPVSKNHTVRVSVDRLLRLKNSTPKAAIPA
ncbi:MAG: hypothetical protein ACLT2T_09785 [Bilophila wadsworthia]